MTTRAHEELHRRLSRVESRNLLFPGDGAPVFWARAQGSEVWDEEGKRYIDFSSAFGVASVGHAHPAVMAAIQNQSDRLLHGMGDVHPSATKVELLERLTSLFGAPARGILSLTGTEAVESAMKTAMIATGRPRIIAFVNAYHGLGFGALAATWRPDFRAPFQSALGDRVVFAPFPEEGSVEESIAAVERELARGDIACVLAEPIQGRGGIRVPAPGALARIAERARRHGALFVLDEVMTGFGRTGRTFAFEHHACRPDIIALGKALGGGVPISAAIGADEVMAAWPDSSGDAIHTSTFLGHPLACRVACEVLDIMERERLGAAAQERGDLVRARLARRGIVLRGDGLMLGFDAGSPERALEIVGRCAEQGLILLMDGAAHDVVEILPPLNILWALLDEGMDILERVLDESPAR